MASSYVDKYVFALMLDSSNFEKGANLASKTIGGLKTTLLKTYSAIGGIDLFKNLINTYTKTAKSIDQINLLTGENITTVQAWQKAISDTGGDVSSFNGTIRSLADDMAQLKNYGTSKYLGTMQWLGISAFKENGELKTATELLLSYRKALSRFDNATAWNYAKSLGIDESTFTLMRRSGDALEKMIKQREKNAVITKEDIIINRQWDRVVSDFQYSWMHFSKILGSNVLPIIQKELFPAIQNGVNYLLGHKGDIKTFFDGLHEELKLILPIVTQLAQWADTLLKAIIATAETAGTVLGKAVGAAERAVNSNVDFSRDINKNGLTSAVSKRALKQADVIGSYLTNPAAYMPSKNSMYSKVFNINSMTVVAKDAESFSNSLEKQADRTMQNDLQPQLGGGIQ